MVSTDNNLLALIRAGLGTEGGAEAALPAMRGATPQDWKQVIDMSFDQGVALLALDGLHAVQAADPDAAAALDAPEVEDAKYEWFGYVFDAEGEYEQYKRSLDELCGFYADRGLMPVVLKGYGLSLNYPVPEHRPVGDIDLVLLLRPAGTPSEKVARHADELVRSDLGIEVESGGKTCRHSHFSYKGIPVENHYFLGDGDMGGARAMLLEDRMQRLLCCPMPSETDGASFALPSATFNAVFLLWHMTSHFTYDAVSLRQLVDWMTFLTAHGGEVDWTAVEKIWREASLDRFAATVNGALVRYLGMPREVVPPFEEDSGLVERFMEDVMRGCTRSWKRVDNVLFYPRSGWKFRLSGEGWWGKMLLRGVVSKIV